MPTFSRNQAFAAAVAALFAVQVDPQAVSVFCDGDVLDSYSDCESCLVAGCGWSEGTCFSECAFVLQDTCHDLFDPADARNATHICAESVNYEADALICESITNCETCTSTIKSDNVTTCEWFDIASEIPNQQAYCGTGGNNVGVYGLSTCNVSLELSNRDLILVEEEDDIKGEEADVKGEDNEKNLRG